VCTIGSASLIRQQPLLLLLLLLLLCWEQLLLHPVSRCQ